MKGTVIAGTNNLFTVECEDKVIRNCTIKGKVIKTDKEFYNPIAPGDVVEIEADSLNDEKGQIITYKGSFSKEDIHLTCKVSKCNFISCRSFS